MRVGIANEETWSFLHEIYTELQEHHQVSLFERRQLRLPVFETRVNRRLFRADLNAFVRANDVVFFEWASELLATATHLPKQCGIVTRLHRYEMYQWVDRINWDAVDKIILVSQAKKREFLERFPGQASKVSVIYEAVDPDKFQPRQKSFGGNIGILCHLTPRKRVYELILAFSELLPQQPDLHLHIGGGAHVAYGDYYDALQGLVRQLKLQDYVTFYGDVQETREWYQEIDIFISNSYSEGLQVAPMEAMASGCYCLSHFWHGADELLPEQYLYFTDRQLQEKICEYYHAPESVKQEEQARMRSIACEKFNIHRTKQQIRKEIEQVARQPASVDLLMQQA
jgi:glycosyltransferase involved in cell wall biosynthesis